MTDLEDRVRRLSPAAQELLAARLDKQSRRTEARQPATGSGPWAVVGLACRLPGAADADEFWQLLVGARDAITEVPADRWAIDEFYSADQHEPGKMVGRWGGFLPDVAGFDAEHFGISPREAAAMDPQQRILLETVWDALHDAGIAPDSLAGSATGVFVGISSSDYALRVFDQPEVIDPLSAPGNAHSVAANRVSYLLDLRGPSVAIDTACSSSLVALHHAVRSLADGESTLAVVGGVNLILSPSTSIAFSHAGGMSPDGRCKAFADGADGMVRSEGCGVVVLKDLAAALRDGDRVRAVVRGTAVNNDGRTNGLTAPSRAAQEAVIRTALARAGVAPGEVQYVEAHGTGTALGDAIEAYALGTAVGRVTGRVVPCAVGSVKSNVGHLEAAAGVTALIKTVLAVQHRQLPPTLHVHEPNRQVPFADLGLAVRRETGPWPQPDRPLVAGVSSFGFGGTNAHAVVGEAPSGHGAPRPAAGTLLLPLSAPTAAELPELAAAYRDRLTRDPASAADVCAAAGTRLPRHPHRLAVVGRDAAELAGRLDRHLAGDVRLDVWSGPAATGGVAFVYSGVGQRWHDAGRALYAERPAFRAAVDACAESVRAHGGPVLDFTAPTPERPTLLTQQAWNFTVQVGLTELFRSWGVGPAATCGHSMGEVAAAWAAGALDLADACRVVVERGRRLDLVGRGRMLAVELTGDEVTEALAGAPDVEIAVENSPTSYVLAGSADAVERLAERWADRPFVRLLDNVAGVSHCALVEPHDRELAAALAGIGSRPAAVPYVSSVTGVEQAGEALDAGYWARNLREPVRFGAAARALLAAGARTFLEIGATPALVVPIVQNSTAAGVTGVVAVPAVRPGRDEDGHLLAVLGRLFAAGADPDFGAVHGGPVRHVDLPRRSWRRRPHWTAAASRRPTARSAPSPEPLPAAAPEPAATAAIPPPAAAETDIAGQVATAVATALGMPAAALDRDASLLDLGLDSIVAVEIRDLIARSTGVQLPLRPLLEGASTRTLTDALAGAVAAGTTDPLAVPADGPEPDFADLPMSAGQRALWFLQQAAPRSTAYNVGEAVRLRGPLDVAAVQAAFDQIARRHPSLRCTFHETPTSLLRRVQPPDRTEVEVVDATGANEAELRRRLSDLVHRPMDLRRPPLFRVVVFRLAAEDHVLLMLIHHLVGDFWSLGTILREFDELYPALAAGGRPSLPAQRYGYADYVAWQQALLASPRGAESLEFWRRRLTPDHPAAEIPGRRRPATPSYRGGKVTFRVDGATTARLRELARQAGTTDYVAVLAAFQVLLARYCGADRFRLGTLTSGRSREEFRDLVGYLVNPVVLRADLADDPSYRQLLHRVRAEATEAAEHADVPFPRVVEELVRDRDPSRSPLFQVLFAWQRAQEADQRGLTGFGVRDPEASVRIGGLELSSFDLEHRTTQFDLSLLMGEVDGEVRGAVEFSTDLYDEPFVRRLADNLCALLARLVDDPDRPVGHADVLTDRERTLLLTGLDTTARPYDLSRTLPELVAEQVARTPEAVAVSIDAGAGQRSLTYRELAERADRLAAHLLASGVAPGDRVGVHDERSVELVVDLLAVMRAGAAYVPLGVELPRRRLEFQLRDAGIRVVLTRSTLLDRLAGLDVTAVPVDEVLPGLPPGAPPPRLAGPDGPAYVIYTSGSTGEPKGVRVPHRGVVNRLLWMQDEYGLGPDDRVLQKTSVTFDVSVWEFFWPLITGARLVLAPPGAHRDPRRLADVVRAEAVTTMHFVPPMLDAFLAERASADLPSLRRVICSGEALRPETVRAFFERFGERPGQRGVELHNLYGPTEASIDVTSWRCRPEDADEGVPIGRPVANTAVYVLDRRRRPVPLGLPGELWISGVQVADGYLGRPELTAERFVADPWRGGRMYGTGDLARRRDDGVVGYLGRLDDQVKVRGFRIEPGEVESALLAHPAVEQCAVTTWERDRSDRRLVAYVVGGDADPAELTRFLAARLPEYMVPAHVVVVGTLPLHPNGKVDRRALPAPDRRAEVAAAPADERERLLADAWRDVLGLDTVSPTESFFALGGDSMSSIRVRAAVEERGWTFDIEDLLRRPTVAALAERLRPLDGAGGGLPATQPFALVEPADRARLPEGLEDAYPPSTMQAGMLVRAEVAADSAVYRVVTSLHVGAPLDADLIRRAVADVVRRHPALRSSFDLSSYSTPLQLVHRDVTVPVEVVDLTGRTADAADGTVRAWVERAKYTVFDPAVPPLLTFTAHVRGPDAFQLSVVEHHAVLDGWSDGVMLAEILDRYRALRAGEEPPVVEVRSTYRDFVAEERRVLTDGAARDHWARVLGGAEPAPLPRRSAGGHAAGTGPRPGEHRSYEVPVDPAVADRLRALARAEGLPLKTLLAAAHVAVLRLVGGGGDVVTGVVANGRLEQAGGDEAIGVFLNTLPLRVDARGGSWLSLARRVFEHERDSAPYRRYPFAQLQRDLGDAVALDSYVNFVDFHLEDHLRRRTGLPVLDGIGVAETNFPLAVNFLLDPVLGRLRLALDCDVSQLDDEFCTRLAGYYERALRALAADPATEPDPAALLGAELESVRRWNDTAVDYDTDATVHGLLARQAAATPDAVAVTHRWAECRYAELAERANRLAHHLIAHGVAKGDRVGVSLPRGVDLLVALVAVLQTGAAYVPLDPGFPRSRLEFVAADARIRCLVTDSAGVRLPTVPTVVRVDDAALADQPGTRPEVEVQGDDAAYVMYTSGSTGLPKGTVVRHRNVVNFFTGMDDRVGCRPDDVVLAVTSVSFDISVLELLWPLARGAKVVVGGERMIDNLSRDVGVPTTPLGFSLFFFAAAGGDGDARDGYRLVLDAARFADDHGFEAVWTPERHFHTFGGLYPNPAVMAAALATTTRRIGLRAGSVVAPLHDTVRIAEEWSVVDNLSGGRVGLAFASGWNSNDFVFFPEQFPRRKARVDEQLDEFRRLWRREPVRRAGGSGEQVDVRIFPAPVQAEPPLWLTSAGAVETFERAGTAGANVLTHLLGQDLDELSVKIRAYRRARGEAGHDGPGRVTVMVHTFVLDDADEAKRLARGPFRDYLRTSTELWRVLFASTGVAFPENVTEEDLESVLDLAVDRYLERSGLFGSPGTTLEMVRQLGAAGADEIACLVDFGVPVDDVLGGLRTLAGLKDAHEDEVAEAEHSFAELCHRHGVTMLQGTPSFLAAVAAEPAALTALHGARAVLVGGEAFPSGLARRLLDELPDTRVFNMYGPTETTIWSTVHELDRAADGADGTIPIGRPIANTEVLVVDDAGRPVPVGVAGELWIGGAGVAKGYLGRPELTDERFVVHPTGEGLVYRTGDRVRWRPDGTLEFLGRVDRQVKILGHRVEPDEVENVLSRHPDVASAAVTAVRRESGTAELVAYVAPRGARLDPGVEDAHVRRWSEVWDSAYAQRAAADRGGHGLSDRVLSDADFAGWVSSYTGEPIPPALMREWLAHTVERVRALRPRAIADVGVGVGLLLRELGPEVERYHGFDVSPAAVEAAAALLGPDDGHVVLERADATRLADLPAGHVDTVVVNSVAQYFPSADYLARVLREAVRVVSGAPGGGAVFLGDVRHLDLLDAFHASVQLHRAPPLTPAPEIAAAARRHRAEERELCLSPAFFRRVLEETGRPGEVRIELKRGGVADEVASELTGFRYDVTIRTGEPVAGAGGPALPWPVAVVDRDAALGDRLAALLATADGSGTRVTVTGIPNRRLARPLALVDLLAAADATSTAWDLERQLWAVDDDQAVDPEELVTAAEALGWRAALLVPAHGGPGEFDASFERRGESRVQVSGEAP